MTNETARILIVGSGIMGAAIARQLRDAHPSAAIVMIDGGPIIGSLAGQHLHDTPEEEIWSRYNQRVSSGVQGLYIGADVTPDVGATVVGAAPGMYNLSAFGADAADMPASAIAWNAGGMGVHWTAATPWPYGTEVFDFIDPVEFADNLATAQRLLLVDPNPYGVSAAGAAMLDALDAVLGVTSDDGRHPQPMPMAITVTEDGMLRTGPNRIFPPLSSGGDDRFELRAGTVCLRLEHSGGRITGAVVRDVATGETSTISADIVAVCADTMRTPQLLWASGIRPAALGKNLNEHAFLTGRITADHQKLGIDPEGLPAQRDGEWFVGSYWLPQSGPRQPFHGQIMDSPILDEATDEPIGYSVGLSWYVPTETRPENFLQFSDTETDPAGMPRITVHYSYSVADIALIDDARASQELAGNALGNFSRERDSLLLPPGSSLHYTGTVRMGAVDDGESVCDPDARVWGFDNLYLAGNGVVPTPLACNSTLTGMVTAVRAARAISRSLSEH